MSKTTTVKKFVRRHKTAVTIAATATVCYAIHRSAVNDWNDFLHETGMTDLYHNFEN